MTICVDQYGSPCDCNQPGAMVARGQSVRATMLTMDGVTDTAGGDPEDEHDRRVSDAWRRPAADTADSASSRGHVADGDDGQAEYERRTCNAWRGAQ